MSSKLVALCGILLTIVAVAFLYDNYRTGIMTHLYTEALGYPPYYRGAVESQAAVKTLATYRGRRSSSMLLDIALRENLLAPEAQTEAIKALGQRNDPHIAAAVASLLQPQEALDTRKAAAGALQNLPCGSECIASILHYLERIWHGEPNLEDRWQFPTGNDQVIANIRAGQQLVYDDLYSILRREKKETLSQLARVYGFESIVPSPFALDLLVRLDVPEACSYLKGLQHELKEISPDRFKAPRQEIQAAIASLNCQ